MARRKLSLFIFALSVACFGQQNQQENDKMRVYVEIEALNKGAEVLPIQPLRNDFAQAFPVWCDGAVVTVNRGAANYIVHIGVSVGVDWKYAVYSLTILEPDGDEVFAHEVKDNPNFFPMEACAVIVHKIDRRIVFLTGNQALQTPNPRFSYKVTLEVSDEKRRRELSQSKFLQVCFGLTPTQMPGEADYSIEVGVQKTPNRDLILASEYFFRVFERAGTKVFESETLNDPTDLLTRACSAIVHRENDLHSANSKSPR